MFARFLTILFYTALGAVILGFLFANRADVTITIPFLMELTAPLYAALALMFGLGLLIGLSYAAILSLGAMRRERRQRRAIAALEREVAVSTKTV